MKTTIITFFTATSALVAAETNSPAPNLLTNSVPALQIPIVEQAELVRQIGEEAAKGFDSVEHARSLRAQIEALVSKPAPAKPDVKPDAADNATPTTDPALKTPAIPAHMTTAKAASASVIGPDPGVLKEAIALLRREADRLEAQLQKLVQNP